MRLKSRETLRALMIQSGITTRMLADRSGLSHGMIDHFLAGRRENTSAEHARQIAAALDTHPNVLWENHPGVRR